MPQDYNDTLQVVTYIEELIDDAKITLGLKYVGFGEENFVIETPAVIVGIEAPLTRELISTGKFELTFEVSIWVIHANLSSGIRDRSREEIELATSVRKLLHSDKTLGGHIIFSYVSSEVPGRIMRPGARTGMLATLLSWTGMNRVLFQDS